jgi:hypothetical protein
MVWSQAAYAQKRHVPSIDEICQNSARIDRTFSVSARFNARTELQTYLEHFRLVMRRFMLMQLLIRPKSFLTPLFRAYQRLLLFRSMRQLVSCKM